MTLKNKQVDIKNLENELYTNANLIQKLISDSKIDEDVAELIDQVSRLNHSTMFSIIEYLKNNQ